MNVIDKILLVQSTFGIEQSIFDPFKPGSRHSYIGPTNSIITSNVQGLGQGQVSATILFDSTNLGDKAYEPSQIEIPVWGNVSWANDDRIAHSVTAIAGEFDSGKMRPDEVFKYTFDKAGGFDYYYMLHPSMIGRVLVR